ncbi:V-type proton ATPase subunit G [Copidosoma floridanum]|uniref:V-type proton ATPase subunit G n=1 Tax=Copidosoma floridanum TaxID=29053 RepID=UPI0006C941B4|nr:V-type proton ATPase subunit G [Copidosoma floridanum]
MASQTQGIQQLLAAEKRAAEKVSDARKRKARRLKQAKEEAQDEIEKYRQEREKQFREFETKHMGSKEDVAAKIDADTRVKIEEMNKQVNANKDADCDEYRHISKADDAFRSIIFYVSS